jgi:hypothetical protein
MHLYPTRDDMVRALVPSAANILEIGVFRGEFADVLLSLNPARLILCDPWDGPSVSGDPDGNNVVGVDLRQVYEDLKRKHACDHRVLLLRGRSPLALKWIEPHSLDAVYIDGDHSYEGCKTDLVEALRLLKPGGWIMGHDYEMNPEKTQARYDFGVKRAVDEFCARHFLEIHAKGLDGCVSYAIRTPILYSGWGC